MKCFQFWKKIFSQGHINVWRRDLKMDSTEAGEALTYEF